MPLFVLTLALFALLGAYLWWNRSALHVAAAHRAFRRGDQEGTLGAFAKAEAAGRLDADTTASYAYLALKNGRTDEARAVLETAFRQGRRGRALKEKERHLLDTYRALVWWKDGRIDEAVELLESLLAEGYRTRALYGNLGFLLQEKGDLERAEALCVEAADWDAEGKVILDNLGSLYLKKGEWEKAAEVYGRLLGLKPQFPEAFYGAGRAAQECGKVSEARELYERALALPFNALTTVDRATVESSLASVSML